MGLSPAASTGPSPWQPALGVTVHGQPPLPWLGTPLAQALALTSSHALLLVGPAGAGQLELAGVLAQTWLCEQPAGALPGRLACGHCASCHLVQQRAHPDLLLLVPDALRASLGWLSEDEAKPSKSEAKPSKDLRVQQVRAAIAWGQQTSGRGRGKVLVLHPADALNGPAANALLKTLEEPPGQLRILLTSADAERLLPTVRSRCQRVALPLPDGAQAAEWLAQRGLAAPEAALAMAGGSPLDALAWAAEGLDAELLAQLPRRVAAGEPAVLQGRPIPRVVDLLVKLCHDAMVQAAGGTPRFYPPDSVPAGADLAALGRWHQALLRTARHDEHPWNAGLLIESLVAQAHAVWASGSGGAGRTGGGAGRPGPGGRPQPGAGATRGPGGLGYTRRP